MGIYSASAPPTALHAYPILGPFQGYGTNLQRPLWPATSISLGLPLSVRAPQTPVLH